MKISVTLAVVALGFSTAAWADVPYPACAQGLVAGSFCTNSGGPTGCGTCNMAASCPAACSPSHCVPSCIDDAGGSMNILECEPSACSSSSGGSSTTSTSSAGTSSGGTSSSTSPNSSGGCSSGFGTVMGPWGLVALSALLWSRRRRQYP